MTALHWKEKDDSLTTFCGRDLRDWSLDSRNYCRDIDFVDCLNCKRKAQRRKFEHGVSGDVE